MTIMSGRLQMLQEALAGYEKTGFALIAYDGQTIKPAGYSDDVGIYYFIPLIARWLNISTEQAITTFFAGLILISLIIGIVGSLLLFKTWLGRLIACAVLLGMSFVAIRIGDVYVASSSVALATIPLFLYLSKNKPRFTLMALFLLMAGLSIGTAHFVRSNSGMAVLIFLILAIIFFFNNPLKRKLALISILLVGVFAATLFFDSMINQREKYLHEHNENYAGSANKHPLWHSVYIGFGFLNNPYGILYSDTSAAEKVYAVAPGTKYLSSDYEMTLRSEVFKLIVNEPRFVVTTIFAKTGVLIFYLLLFSNLGLLLAIYYRKHWGLEVAFGGAILFNSLFGLLVVPIPEYLLGFFSIAALYGIVSTNHAIENGLLDDILALSKRIEGKLSVRYSRRTGF